MRLSDLSVRLSRPFARRQPSDHSPGRLDALLDTNERPGHVDLLLAGGEKPRSSDEPCRQGNNEELMAPQRAIDVGYAHGFSHHSREKRKRGIDVRHHIVTPFV